MRAEFLERVYARVLGRPVADAANGRIRHALSTGDLPQLTPRRVFETLDQFFYLHAPSMPEYQHKRKVLMPEYLHYPTNGEEGHSSDMGDARANAAANLKRIRLALGYSVYALAAKAGVSRATIDSIEGDRNAVGLDKLEAVANALGLKAWELLQPPRPTALKAVQRTPGTGANRKATGAAAELLQSLNEVHRQVRKHGGVNGKETPHEEVSARSLGADRDKPRPKGGEKVGKAGKSRTRT